MPVQLSEIRDLLLPGLRDFVMCYESLSMKGQWNSLFIPQSPHIWIPKLSIPQAVAVGAAAAIIKNPTVTRRFWSGWAQ